MKQDNLKRGISSAPRVAEELPDTEEYFEIENIKGLCRFGSLTMSDGMAVAGYVTGLESDNLEIRADAMKKIGALALKYLEVDGQPVKDAAGLIKVLEDTEKKTKTSLLVLSKFMQGFDNFL